MNKKLAYPYENLNSIDDDQKHVNNIKKEDFFSKLKNKCPVDEELQRTKENIKIFHIKNLVDLTHLYLKSDVIILADVFEKFIKISFEEYGNNPLHC